MQLQAKVSKTLRQDLEELLGIVTFFEPHDHIVKVTDDANIALSIPLTPLMSPEIKHIVEIDVSCQGRITAPLRAAHLTLWASLDTRLSSAVRKGPGG